MSKYIKVSGKIYRAVDEVSSKEVEAHGQLKKLLPQLEKTAKEVAHAAEVAIRSARHAVEMGADRFDCIAELKEQQKNFRVMKKFISEFERIENGNNGKIAS